MSLDQYITCLENCSLRHLESLAMIGLAERADVEDCEKKNFQKIILHLINGKLVTSECFYHEEVAQSLKIINIYIEITKRNRAPEKLVIVKPREGLSED